MVFLHPRLLTVVTALILGGCVGLSVDSPPASSAKPKTSYNLRRDLVFTPPTWPKPLPAHLYQPEGSGPFPGVILVHGGSWSASDHRWQMRGLGRKLARRGFIVMSVTYRGAPEFRHPAQIDDLHEAVRWLRGHAPELKLDPDKIGAYGFSSGGHLAALLGTLDGIPEVRVQAVVAAGAPADLTLYPGGEILPRLLGATFADQPELYRAASPVTHVSADDPPVFLYHGTNDKTVSPDHAKAFKAALDQAKVPNKLFWLEGRGHATTLLFGGAAEDAAIDFLDAHLR